MSSTNPAHTSMSLTSIILLPSNNLSAYANSVYQAFPLPSWTSGYEASSHHIVSTQVVIFEGWMESAHSWARVQVHFLQFEMASAQAMFLYSTSSILVSSELQRLIYPKSPFLRRFLCILNRIRRPLWCMLYGMYANRQSSMHTCECAIYCNIDPTHFKFYTW